jgi:Mycothiol maleylpyruvate isomerase N-terminal domain
MGEIGDAYRGIRERVNGLVAGADVDSVAPATPGWTVADLLAHLTGVTTDIVQGNLDGVGTDEWTARQVSERRGRPTEELLAEWNEHGTAVEAMADQLGPASGRLLSDAVTHEHDIRGAWAHPARATRMR